MGSALHADDLMTIQDFDEHDIMLTLDQARAFHEVNERAIKKLPTLRGRTVINLFFEASTRTRTSFEIAGKRLSADTINISGSASSTTKGESLADTAETLSAMNCDLAVIRHRYAGSPRLLKQHMGRRTHVINAGDGKHQHPTQTLLDLYTIRDRFGSFEGLKVGIVGDIVHSRVAGSLCPALDMLGATAYLVGPPTLMPSRPDILPGTVVGRLDDILPELDVVYMLRIQQERIDESPFPSLREYSMLFGIDERRLATLADDAIIMHPGPVNRGVELCAAAADSARSRICDQVTAGVAVRMAAMYLLLGGEDHGSAA